MGFRMLPAVVAIVTVALLSGCVPQEPVITPEPEPSSTPVFASDEEALAAATDAYAKYVAEVDKSLMSYDTGMLADVADLTALQEAIDRVKQYKDAHEHQVGDSEVASSSIATAESVLGSAHIGEPVQIYICLDISRVDVLNGNNNSTVAPDRPDVVPLLVSLNWEASRDQFKVTKEEVWGGVNDC